MEVLQMFRRKAETRMVELSPDEARLLRGALLAFRNKLLSAGKPTEDTFLAISSGQRKASGRLLLVRLAATRC